MNKNKESNQPIRLTEQDLHFLVEEAVKGYLVENGMDEGIWGGLKNVAQKGASAVGRGLQNAGRNVRSTATNAYNNVTGATSNAVNQVKTAYQQGNAQQDLNNVNNALKPMVQKGIIDQNTYKQILGRLNRAMRNQGGQNMQGIQ
jgi:ribosomal protein S20